MSGFKKSGRPDRKKEKVKYDTPEKFAAAAPLQGNRGKDKSTGSMEGFYTKLQPKVKMLIQALSYDQNISQREVVESGILRLIEEDPEKAKEAVQRYKNQEKKKYRNSDVSDAIDNIIN
jgi:hypothetical protein